jgi:uncharacterized membrane protein YGL010W
MATESASPAERWFAAYADDHRHPVNQRLHVICVPAIVWSILAILQSLPVPEMLATAFALFGVGQGAWAALAALAAVLFWSWLSLPLGIGTAVLAALCFWLNASVLQSFGSVVLLAAGIAVFVLAWIGQFVGHLVEGRRPSFFTDLVYLMIGPPWVLAKAYRLVGLDR